MKWINVNDFLPEAGKKYTVKTKSTTKFPNFGASIPSNFTNTLQGISFLYDENNKPKWSCKNQVVTHWLDESISDLNKSKVNSDASISLTKTKPIILFGVNVKEISFYIQAYLFQLPLVIIHELSHYIIAVFGFIILHNTWPKFYVDYRYKIETDEDNDSCSSSSFSGYINYCTFGKNEKDTFSFFDMLIALAPAITTITLLIVLPFWLKLYILANISSIWLSQSDIRQINQYFKQFK